MTTKFPADVLADALSQAERMGEEHPLIRDVAIVTKATDSAWRRMTQGEITTARRYVARTAKHEAFRALRDEVERQARMRPTARAGIAHVAKACN